MVECIIKLLEFQKADIELDEAEKKLKSSTERKTANQMKQRYELAVEERKKLISLRDETEKNLALIESETEKLSSLAMIDRTKDISDDMAAVNKLCGDVEKLLSQLKKLEDRLNAINDELRVNEKKISDYAAIANKAREEFNTNKTAYEQLLKQAKPELSELKAKRDALKGNVDEQLIKRYEIIKARKLIPTAPIKGKRCGGCNMEMPAFTLSKASKNGYCECENCGRIVYIAD